MNHKSQIANDESQIGNSNDWKRRARILPMIGKIASRVMRAGATRPLVYFLSGFRDRRKAHFTILTPGGGDYFNCVENGEIVAKGA